MYSDLLSKVGQQPLVTDQVVKHPNQELRFGTGGANLARFKAGCDEKARKPLAIPGEIGKRLNCKPFCRFHCH